MRPRLVAKKASPDGVKHTARNDGITEYVAAMLQNKYPSCGIAGVLTVHPYWRKKALFRLEYSTVEVKAERGKARPRYAADRKEALLARDLLMGAYLRSGLQTFGEEGLLLLPKPSPYGWIAREIENANSALCRELQGAGFDELVGLKRDWRWWRRVLNIKRNSAKKRR
jgi:hypothetical protein